VSPDQLLKRARLTGAGALDENGVFGRSWLAQRVQGVKVKRTTAPDFETLVGHAPT
jgi:hypothetical protein